VDLLTESEQRGGSGGSALSTEIDLLADRLAAARVGLPPPAAVRGLRGGYFGGGCGTAAALRLAARKPEAFGAMVMLGGRPDLVGEGLGRVRTPTLFIAGAGDLLVIEWNRKALVELGGEKDLRVIPGASHMFEEIGVIEDVAELAHGWYRRHLMV
jgi:pimeloyl-ACP methyl ester carboxylesterase